MRGEQAREQRRAAAVQAGEEDEAMIVHGAASYGASTSVRCMRTRHLGDGGPEVSVVGLGTNNFGRRCDYEQTLAVIDAALDAGVTLFDTADIYGQGMSEDYIGRALEGRRDQRRPRDEVRHADGRRTPTSGAAVRDYIRWAVEGSLRRLRTDVIDLYQLHRPDDSTPIVETLGALNELVEEGKVRWIGSSNFSAEQIEAAEEVARGSRLPRASSRCRTSTRSSSARRRTRCCPRASGSGSASSRTSRSRAGCSPASTGAARSRRRDASPGRRSPTSAGTAPRRCSAFADERGISLLDVAIGGLLASLPSPR